ncbi:MAG: hypothetical protein KDI36_15750, partial [Pseudomonadales bacterium]|nr:hypothetical protein [Pseudomonadales bacterium]
MNIDTGGAITDGNADAVTTDGTVNVTATTLNITGDQAVTSIETEVSNLDLTTAATSIANTGALTLTSAAVTSNLTLSNDASITATGIVTVTGLTTLDAGGTTAGVNDIDISVAGTNLNSLTLVDTGNVLISDVDSLTFNGYNQIGGRLDLRIDSDNNESATLTISPAVTTGTDINYSGSSLKNDNIILTTDQIATAGNITISDAGIVDVNGNLTAGAGLSITNANSVQLVAGTTIIASDGDLDLATNNNSVRLEGGTSNASSTASNTITIDQNGTGTVSVGALDDVVDGLFTHFTVNVEDTLNLGSVDLNDANRDGLLTINLNGTGSQTAHLNDTITNISALSVTGTGTNDVLDINANIASGGLINFANLSDITIDSATTRTITSFGSISASSNVSNVTLDAGGSTVSFDVNGNGDLTLSQVRTLGTGASLSLSSEGNITLAAVDLAGATAGAFTAEVDSNNDSASTLFVSDAITNVGALQFSGSLANNDIINVDASITSGGNLVMSNAADLQVQNGVIITAEGGNLQLDSLISKITLDGTGTGTVTFRTITADNDISLAQVDGTLANHDLLVSSTGTINIVGAVNLGNANDLQLIIDADADVADAVDFVLNQSVTANLVIIDGDNEVSQTGGAITANELLLSGSNVTHTLNRAANDFGKVAADTGAVTLVDSSGFNVDSVNGTDGITASGDVSLSLGGDLTLNQQIAAGVHDITVTTTGAIVDGYTAGSDLTGGLITLHTATGAGSGSGNELETTASTLNITNSTSGEIRIANSGNLNISGISQSAAGLVSVSSTGALTVSGSGITLSGTTATTSADIELTADAGSLSVNAAITNDNLDGDANITLTASGANSDVNVNAAVSVAAGAISLSADDALIISAAGDITASGAGGIALLADADSSAGGNSGDVIQMADGAVADADAGTVSLNARGNITLGELKTSSASTTAVDITTLAGVLDTADTNGSDITAASGTVVISAATGIGSANALEIAAASVDVSNTTSGSVELVETDAVTISRISQGAANLVSFSAGGDIDVTTSGIAISNTTSAGAADILLTASGNINVSAAIQNQNLSNLAVITLDANGAGSDISFVSGASVTTANGALTINADDSITFDTSAITLQTSGTGSITLKADAADPIFVPVDGGVVTMSDATTLNAAAGLIDVRGEGDLTIGRLVTTSAATNAVTLVSSQGGIVDSGSSAVDVDAASGRLVIDAVTGVGSSNAIETTVTSIDIDNTGANDISLVETDALTVNRLNQLLSGGITLVTGGNTTTAGIVRIQDNNTDIGPGAISITAAGNLTINQLIANESLNSAAGISLTSTGAGNQLATNASISSQAGAISLIADGDVSINSDLTATGSGAVTLTAGQTGAVGKFLSQADGSLVDAGSGVIDVNATGDIAVAGFLTTSNAASAIDIDTSGGAISDAGDSHTDIVTTNGTLTLSALNAIGSANALEINTGTLVVTNATDANLNETNSLILGSVTTSGSLNLNLNGQLSGTAIVNVSGTATINAGGTTVTTHDISLTNSGNSFGTLALTGGNATVAAGSSVNLGATTLGGLYDLTVAGGIDLTGTVSAASLDMDASGGAGNISDSTGQLLVSGNSVLRVAASGDSIVLDTASNDVNLVTITQGTDVTLVDADDIQL